MSEATASEHLLDLLFLANWNTRIVVLGVVMLGAAGGVVGSFMLLRRRVLIGDAVSHATLPGIAIAFLLATGLGFEGRSMPVLLVGALGAGLLGIAAIQLLNHGRRVSHDAALGVVLSTFFGTGVALLGVAQQHPSASVAGLESFIYGKTASMLQADAILIGAVALGTGAVCLLFFKEFRLVCFDPGFARGRGLSVLKLDLLLMSLVVSVVIVGLQAVGVVLVIAILVIPAASARFWTDSTGRMVLIAGGLGALGGWIGAVASAIAPRLPSGALVVLALGGLFLLSLSFGGRHGLLHQAIQTGRRTRRIRREHALRAILECLEVTTEEECTVEAVAERRGWETRQAQAAVRALDREGLAVIEHPGGETTVRLSESGRREAEAVVRRHRLWEHYLIRHARFDSGHVDRGADELEHLLPVDILEQLEAELSAEASASGLPSSPHRLEDRPGGEAPIA